MCAIFNQFFSSNVDENPKYLILHLGIYSQAEVAAERWLPKKSAKKLASLSNMHNVYIILDITILHFYYYG